MRAVVAPEGTQYTRPSAIKIPPTHFAEPENDAVVDDVVSVTGSKINARVDGVP